MHGDNGAEQQLEHWTGSQLPSAGTRKQPSPPLQRSPTKQGKKEGSVRPGVRGHGVFVTEGGYHGEIFRVSVIITFLLLEDHNMY